MEKNAKKALSDEDALKAFLLDIECLEPLAEWTEPLNIFDILKSGKTEIKHSKVLAWLMTVDGNHRLGDTFVREFVKKVIKNNPNMDYDLFDWSFIDYSSQIVRTEEHNIDITVRFEGIESKNIIVIENKTKTTEHTAGKSGKPQTVQYREQIEKDYGEYKKLFVYLTSMDEQPEDFEYWCVLSYDDILDIIETTIKDKELLPQVKLIIDNYCDLIKQSVIGRDTELFRECNLVYNNHREAIQLLFDYSKNKRIRSKNKNAELLKICDRVYALYEQELELIYQNKEDKTAQLVEKLVELICKTEDFEMTTSSGKTYVTFTSKALNDLIPELPTPISSWETKNTYQFWFHTVDYKSDEKIKLAVELGGNNLTGELTEIHNKIINGVKPSNMTSPYTYKILRSVSKIDFSDIDKGFDQALSHVKKWVEEIKSAIEM